LILCQLFTYNKCVSSSEHKSAFTSLKHDMKSVSLIHASRISRGNVRGRETFSRLGAHEKRAEKVA